MPEPGKIPNQLKDIRKNRGLLQKQIAFLLRHSSPDQVSRYERGVQLPNLKTALKLGIIFQTPLPTLFDGVLENCGKELKKAGFQMGKPESLKALSVGVADRTSDDKHYCRFEEILRSPKATETELREVDRHTIDLVKLRAKIKNHI